MKTYCWIAVILVLGALGVRDAVAQTAEFNGLGMSMSSLSQLSHARTRSASPENPTGEKGKGGMATTGTGANAARDLGQGWKISPSIRVESKKVLTLADLQGPGAIQHIWMTPSGHYRFSILRFYWDGESQPSVEVPVGDFFACGWGIYAQVSSLAVCVNPLQRLQLLLANALSQVGANYPGEPRRETLTLYYQVDYTLTEVPDDAAYFHAQFRRSNPLPYKTDHVIIDGVKGWGQYVGTYWLGEATTRAGGEKAKSSSSSTATASFPPSWDRHGRLFLRRVRFRRAPLGEPGDDYPGRRPPIQLNIMNSPRPIRDWRK